MIDRSMVAMLHAQGLSDVAIASAVGCSRNNVTYIRKKLGLHANLIGTLPIADRLLRDKAITSGLSDKEISAKLGISTAAVYHARCRLGIKRASTKYVVTPVPKDIKAKLVKLHRRGLTDVLMAEHLGMSVGKVTRMRKKIGLHSHRTIIDKGMVSAVRRLNMQGKKDREVAAELGISHVAVHKIRVSIGLAPNGRIDAKAALYMLSNGEHIVDVAKKLRTSQRSIRKVISRIAADMERTP